MPDFVPSSLLIQLRREIRLVALFDRVTIEMLYTNRNKPNVRVLVTIALLDRIPRSCREQC